MLKSIFRFLPPRPSSPCLENETYQLRRPAKEDFAQWRSLRLGSREFLTPWEPTWHDADFTASAYEARRLRDQRDYRAGQIVPLFLFQKREKLLLGGLTIGHVRRGAAQSCMIGYWMGAPYAGQGHMFAALGMVIPYIFRELELHRIEAACIPGNKRSIRLLEKAGFQYEGHLRDYMKINGRWHDHLMFARLATDAD